MTGDQQLLSAREGTPVKQRERALDTGGGGIKDDRGEAFFNIIVLTRWSCYSRLVIDGSQSIHHGTRFAYGNNLGLGQGASLGSQSLATEETEK